ncbi:hypothetical protein [Microbacterium sp. bgisy203]|uniref:hypothetical protein n=1 Tax=Microbacterium sp. bgisy203 TaxID=3413799 RepID=UPI003D75F814
MTVARSLAIAAVVVAATLSLSACDGTSAPVDASPSETPAAPATESTPTGEDGDAAADSGCTDAMLSFMDQNGYADPTPADVADFSLPEAGPTSVEPACYVADDIGGAVRKGAIYTGDTDAAMASIRETLDAAGYAQSDAYGAYVWWLGGDGPTTATYAVGAGPTDIGGEPVVWMTWATQ